MTSVRIVLANGSLAGYPEGGGHWSFFLQYLLGLDALRYDVFWLELLRSSGDDERDRRLIDIFSRRVAQYGLGERCGLLLYRTSSTGVTLEATAAFGASAERIRRHARSADVLWNFACALRQPLLSLFRRRVLIDLDPGHLQVSALDWDMDIREHHAFLTAGTRMHDPDCRVPRLGLEWRPFLPFVHLPAWSAAHDPGRHAGFTSVTQWTWERLWLNGQMLSVSKRDAYRRYLELPGRTGLPFELAANIHANDQTGDREELLRHGWRLVHPHDVAADPAAYQRYIMRSRAELSCPKPIHRELRTGWFSDRSAAYLATGRPVVMEDTGIGNRLPTGEGLLLFRDMDEAVAAVAEIDANYGLHARAARALAETYMDSRRCLEAMVSASF